MQRRGRRIAKLLKVAAIFCTIALAGDVKQTLTGHSNWVNAVAFSPDGKLVASASLDWTVKLWDAGTGKVKQTLSGDSSLVNAVAFSPDGKLVASASYDNIIKLWDAGTGKVKQTLSGDSSLVNAVAFSPDGKLVASASRDKIVKLWDAGTGEMKRTLTGHSDWVSTVAFSPDGKLVASAKLWDAGTGGVIKTLRGSSVRTISFDTTTPYLLTNVCRIKFNIASPTAPVTKKNTAATHAAAEQQREQQQDQQRYGLGADGSWITWDGQDVLCLPPEFRPSCSAVSGSTIAIGCAGGRVLLFKFTTKPL